MKRCPKCNRTYQTDTQKFCTYDGGLLVTSEVPLAETISIESAQLDDAPTKAISRELVPDATNKFDPYRTTMGKSPAAGEGTAEVRARVTEDLPPTSGASTSSVQEQTSASLPSSPPQPTSGSLPTSESLPASDSGTLPSLPPSPMLPQTEQPSTPRRSDSGPITTSGPLPTVVSAPSPSVRAARTQRVQALKAPPAAKKSKLPLILGILAVLFVLGVGVLGMAYFFVVRPRLEARRVVATPVESPEPQPSSQATPTAETTPNDLGSTSTKTENEPPSYSPPADAVEFVNSKEKLDGKLAEHYVDFSFYYPERWLKDSKSGVPGASNFVKVERRLPPDFTQENFAVGWYSSSGSVSADRALFPTLVENLSAQFAKNFPEYSKVSEGETKAGVYNGYEFRFEAFSRNTAKGDIKIWGRAIFLPPTDGGTSGVTLLMLATSLAPELKTVNDVGVKGELPMILDSFRFGKKQ